MTARGRLGLGAIFRRRETMDVQTLTLRTPLAPGEEMFLESLTPEQLRTWQNGRYIDVISNRGRRWRLSQSMTQCMNDGKCYCVGIRYDIGCPMYDHMLAKALAIRTDEADFLNIACHIGTFPIESPFTII